MGYSPHDGQTEGRRAQAISTWISATNMDQTHLSKPPTAPDIFKTMHTIPKLWLPDYPQGSGIC